MQAPKLLSTWSMQTDQTNFLCRLRDCQARGGQFSAFCPCQLRWRLQDDENYDCCCCCCCCCYYCCCYLRRRCCYGRGRGCCDCCCCRLMLLFLFQQSSLLSSWSLSAPLGCRVASCLTVSCVVVVIAVSYI